MRRSAFLPLLALALALPARAQGPGPGPERGPGGMGGPGGPPMGPSPAEMLLAQTGELKLTDAQVVRLAAIARRTAERRAAMRNAMPRPPADGARRQPPSDAEMQRMRQQMEQAHEQGRADLRDALAVLTPDQQAIAFEHLAMRRGPGGPGGPGEMRGMRMRREGGLPGRARERRPDGPGDGTPPPPPRDGDAPRPPQP